MPKDYFFFTGSLEYSVLKGKRKIHTSANEFDINKAFEVNGDTAVELELSFGLVTADTNPFGRYKGGVRRLYIYDPTFSVTGLQWMRGSGFLESPRIIELELHFTDSGNTNDIIPLIKLPKLTSLVFNGSVSIVEGQTCELCKLLSRSPSITELTSDAEMHGDPSIFVRYMESMPALNRLTITESTMFSEAAFTWAMSERNQTVSKIALNICPSMHAFSPKEFFLHPCIELVTYIADDQEFNDPYFDARLYAAVDAKFYVARFARVVRDGMPIMRLPRELVWMVFVFEERLSEIYT